MTTIAISGKGGTGKTTIAALIIRWLADHLTKSILAVDADSNVNLNDLLGVEVRETVGGIREEMRRVTTELPGGMTKQQYLEYKIQASLTETPEFDLIAMGRPEGPGCYCYANNLLRDILRTLGTNYKFVVIDNEAGMEHLSRRTTQAIDHLLIVSDPTPRGLVAAGKISRLLAELETRVRERYLVLNRMQLPFLPSVAEWIAREGLSLLGVIPEDETLRRADLAQKPVWSLLPQTDACRAVGQMLRKILGPKNEARREI
ncbi:MAG: AAA family ATPase [Acidobacteriota bacterium]